MWRETSRQLVRDQAGRQTSGTHRFLLSSSSKQFARDDGCPLSRMLRCWQTRTKRARKLVYLNTSMPRGAWRKQGRCELAPPCQQQQQCALSIVVYRCQPGRRRERESIIRDASDGTREAVDARRWGSNSRASSLSSVRVAHTCFSSRSQRRRSGKCVAWPAACSATGGSLS